MSMKKKADQPKYTRVYLIRHGEVVHSEPKRYNGHRDVDLSTAGLSQIEQMAVRLSLYPITAIYCSDLVRAYKGAQLLSRGGTIPVHPKPALREKSFGEWEGLTYDEVASRYPMEWEQWLADPVSSRPPGGETFREVRERVLQELFFILKESKGQEIVIMAHGGANRVVLCHALQLDLKHVFRIEQKFAALNIIDFTDEQTASVQLMNG
jgi:alpha-ribazole phosphatase